MILITCIAKEDVNATGENDYTRISHLCWINPANNGRGRHSRNAIYDFIHDQHGDARIRHGGSESILEALITSVGTKYVRSKADDTTADNLLSLPECDGQH